MFRIDVQESKPLTHQVPVTRFLTKLTFNNSNSCYLNGLLHFLASSARLNAADAADALQQLNPLGYDLASLFNSINEITGEEDATQYHADAFSAHLARADVAFKDPGQKDAHEALLVIFQRLQEELFLREKRCQHDGTHLASMYHCRVPAGIFSCRQFAAHDLFSHRCDRSCARSL
jgi:ubiquitin C-terminal hydrolase